MGKIRSIMFANKCPHCKRIKFVYTRLCWNCWGIEIGYNHKEMVSQLDNSVDISLR